MTEYFNLFISKYQCRSRKGFRAQYCLASMLENGRKCVVDNKRIVFHLT